MEVLEAAPRLRSPDRVVIELAAQLGAIGQPIEEKYLSSRIRRHRWAARSFRDLGREFECKAVWVAKFLRDAFGSPDHIAYLALVESRLVGMRAAAWALGGAVVYVSLRRLDQASAGRKHKPAFEIVLGTEMCRQPRGTESTQLRADSLPLRTSTMMDVSTSQRTSAAPVTAAFKSLPELGREGSGVPQVGAIGPQAECRMLELPTRPTPGTQSRTREICRLLQEDGPYCPGAQSVG